jgi:hypothetical protein
METKKLFHAIVVMGMTAAAACSSSTPDPGQDAAASNDSSTSKDTGGGQDVTTNPDTGSSTDASTDVKGWLGC